MQKLFEELNTLEEENYTEENDILSDLEALTKIFNTNSNGDIKTEPWYCALNRISDNYDLSDKEIIDLAEKNGYKIVRIPSVGSIESFLAVADKDLDLKEIEDNIRDIVKDEFEDGQVPEIKVTEIAKKESISRMTSEDSQKAEENKNKKVTIKYGSSYKDMLACKPIKVTMRTLDDYKEHYTFVELVDESLDEEFMRVSDEDCERLEKRLNDLGFDIVSKQEYGYGEEPINIHYQIITKEGNQTKESFNEFVDKIDDLLDEFEDETGSPCTFNAGLQTDGYVSCGFDARGIYYKPGEDVEHVKPMKLRYKDGKPADKQTELALKSLSDRMDADVSKAVPVDKNESLEEEIDYENDVEVYLDRIPYFFDKDKYNKEKFNDILEDIYKREILDTLADLGISKNDVNVVADVSYGDINAYFKSDFIERINGEYNVEDIGYDMDILSHLDEDDFISAIHDGWEDDDEKVNILDRDIEHSKKSLSDALKNSKVLMSKDGYELGKTFPSEYPEAVWYYIHKIDDKFVTYSDLFNCRIFVPQNDESAINYFNKFINDLKNESLEEGVDSTSPMFKRGMRYFTRYPNTYAFICSFKNPKTKQTVYVAQPCKTKEECKAYVNKIIKDYNSTDIEVMYASNLQDYVKALNGDDFNATKESLDEDDIDINNLDLYDDEDIYETDDKGFVLLPKKLKKDIRKQKEVKEDNPLLHTEVSTYKYLLDVYDTDNNFIERKFFRSRPEADKFVDAMSDLFDIKIYNNEVVELENGKDFFGTYWKVIRDVDKDESLKEGMDIDDFITVAKQNEYTGKYHGYEYARKQLVKEWNEKVKEFPYWVVKTSESWDSDGVYDYPKTYSVLYGGSEVECKERINKIYNDAKADKQYQKVEDYKESESVTIYYPHAISRATYLVMKNNGDVENPKKEGLDEDIEKHDTLNPVLFDGEELKPEVKDAIQKIADTFVEEIKEDDVNLVLKDVVLVGSNVNYNYTKDSDLDIHLIVDSKALDCPQEITDKLYGCYRTIFNKNYDINIKGIPAEIYVELDEPKGISNGVYSLNTGWIKKPVQQDIPEIDRDAFNALFNEYEDKYTELMSNENKSSEDVENFINMLYDIRKEGVQEEGEFSLKNLLFKEFRNLGYLDDMKELRRELKGKELSLESIDNSNQQEYNNVEENADMNKEKNNKSKDVKESKLSESKDFDMFEYAIENLDKFPELKDFVE